MTSTVAAIIWALGAIAWVAIRYPYQRRARRIAVVAENRDLADGIFLTGAGVGLSVLPIVFLLTGFPAFATHAFHPWMGWAGAAVEVAFVWLFIASHRQLGRNWSITLEIRDSHRLVTDGLYRYVRHPMYSSFWLWAIAQAFLIPNWVAGLAGLVGVAGLYFSRVGKEEAMMERTFGDQYRAYRAVTGRVIPKLV